jgi:hypothetical protein
VSIFWEMFDIGLHSMSNMPQRKADLNKKFKSNLLFSLIDTMIAKVIERNW